MESWSSNRAHPTQPDRCLPETLVNLGNDAGLRAPHNWARRVLARRANPRRLAGWTVGVHQLLLRRPSIPHHGRPSGLCLHALSWPRAGTAGRQAISATASWYRASRLLVAASHCPPLDVDYVPLIRASAHTMIPPGIIYWQRLRGSSLSFCWSGYRCANCLLGRWPKRVHRLDPGPRNGAAPQWWEHVSAGPQRPARRRRHRLPVGTVPYRTRVRAVRAGMAPTVASWPARPVGVPRMEQMGDRPAGAQKSRTIKGAP